MDKIKQVKREIKEILSRSIMPEFDMRHGELVLSWVLKLKPDADDALQIAALAHDIERGYYGKDKLKYDPAVYAVYDDYKNEHAHRGAQAIKVILKKYDFERSFIEKVKYLVENHECGGNEEVNILRDADSISYFFDRFDSYLEEKGLERAKIKVEYMFDRISDGNKEKVGEIYKQVLKKLENYKFNKIN
ncbi:MAG: hypothetical protein A2538_03665 [Candidatus Magasanikbacteria bacterium RIFOXYD2_FULL_41_14]|uniref:HD domain-containing protein n=1 Tax=Candidatus Magasanikbacteria bacterium RIFOXYD2_FULL_41_14 TaxID=1798709 RepID=A0A1F6PCP6_9BACT|nr:MAG: hypothetical protein A2538_03665 [Candidatus Magasanikbacteria bacterium RIFOXYD2_FULL_41_14]